MQNLLNHTYQRLVPNIPLEESNSDTLFAYCKIGFDGNSGRNEYNVRNLSNTNCDYKSIMHSAVVPLKITDTANNIFWQNPNSSSVRFCRPLRISWEKEDKETTQREYNRLKNEIDNLYLTEIVHKGNQYKLIHKPILSMFDGKAVNNLTNTASSMVCPNCSARPNDFNKIDSITKFPLNKNSLEFGIPYNVNSWIRVYFASCL